MKQKLICLLLALMLPIVSWGAVPLPARAGSDISLEQAINIAKSNFTVPEAYSEFVSRYNEYGERASWWLNWSGSPGEISIEVDALSGDILNMHHYFSWEQSGVKLPKLGYQEAKDIADALVQKLHPERKQDLVLLEDPENPSLEISYWGPPSYSFYYQRVVEGIPYPDNGIRMRINGNTGEIISYSFDWYPKPLEVPDNLLSDLEARKIFEKEFPLELLYFRTQPEDEDKEPSIIPVFMLRYPERVRIDPVTGEILDFDGGYGIAEEQEAKDLGRDSAALELTPEELEEIDRIGKLISKEEAVEAALKVLELAEEYQLERSRLYRLWDEPDKIVWELSWQGDREQDFRGYAGATVDGATGELLSFYRYRYDEELAKQEPVYSREEARELAWQLMKKLQPEKAEEVRFYDGEMNRETELQRSYSFKYERIVNGIPFPQNGFQITVNAVTGQVERYSLQWTDAQFPRLNTVIDEAQATAWYAEEVPVSLEFVTFYDRNSGEEKPRLLYHLTEVPYTMLDAVSGLPLNFRGEPLEKTLPAVFSDIENHAAQKEIELLVAAGVIEGTEDGKFYPDAAITQGELARMLSKLERNQGPIVPLPGISLNQDAWYTPWIKQTVAQGLIKEEEVAPEEAINREFLAAVLVRYLGLEKVAVLSDLYLVRFADAAEIAPEYLGHVTLADGLAVIPAGENFLPKQLVTKGEAAQAIVKALQQ